MEKEIKSLLIKFVAHQESPSMSIIYLSTMVERLLLTDNIDEAREVIIDKLKEKDDKFNKG